MSTLARINKEAYFSPGNIDDVSRAMLDKLAPLRERHREQEFKVSQAALLVLDMQRYFLEAASHAFIPSAPTILPGIRQLVDAFSLLERPVILTRHLNSAADAGTMSFWWRDLIQEESSLSQVVDELVNTGLREIRKSQYDGFYKTSLEQILRVAGVKQVLICGVMTHLCCETTARSAFMRGFEVFVLVDGMATYNSQFHEASLLNLAHGFAYPMLVSEISALLVKEIK